MLKHLLLCALVSYVYCQSDWHQSNCQGTRRAIVHLFEWKWSNIADECESFLGPRGYCGVQVSPPNENAVIDNENEPTRPWWERYQPVSYLLETRSGSEAEFIDMVQRCNNVGVRIYVDAIINHMAGVGRSGVGTGGTDFDSDAGSFPGVPYEMDNFNGCETCPSCCCINSWTDHAQVRNCRLSGLIDLNQAYPDTASKIAGYMNTLIDIGVAGFRIDAAKHMWPNDIEALWGQLNSLNTDFFPAGSSPFIYLEVIDMNQNGEINVHEYKHLGRVTEFRFCSKVREAAGGLWSIPGIYDPGWGMCEPEHAFVFVDNHDNQRGHGSGGQVVTHKDPTPYKIAQAISLGWDYGFPRVMSSFDFGDDTDTGPPHDGDYNTADVIIEADGSCSGGWICEHRWPAIAGMAGWAKVTTDEPVQDWWNEGNKAAWHRGAKGFVAMTNEGMDHTLQTGLPAGDYCNVIQGCASSSGCEDGVETITVGADGTAHITITDTETPIVAIHIEAMAGSGQCIEM